MTCAEMRQFAADWEDGLDRAAEAALGHVHACPECRLRYGAFMALVERDVRGALRRSDLVVGAAEGAAHDEAIALADRVMAELVPARRRPASLPFRPMRRRAFGFAAVAALALSAAFAVGLAARGSDTMVVRFALEAPDASSVVLAGDFSSWSSEGLELERSADGVWERTVRLKRGRSYSYNFLVDGEVWVVDPAAPERIDDGFGGESALLRL